MTTPIRSAAVIGAGVMGSGIAAHLANAGIPTLLLDMVPPDLGAAEQKDPRARDRVAAAGLERALNAKPAAFYHPSQARLITVGNVEDDLDQLEGCDLVIEAIIENLEAKRALFANLEQAVSSRAIVASNTSGLPISELMRGRCDGFRKRFLVAHFFNPVRYMKLLELVAGPTTDPGVVERMRRFGADVLGKGVILGRDTPNFVGNRIGVYAMMTAIHQMLADGLSPEDVDAVAGEPLARPKSAAFRTADMVGLDTFVHVADNCHAALAGDEEQRVFAIPDYIRQMVAQKRLGDKTKAGFYRKGPAGIETLDPKTGEYRPRQITPAVEAAVKALKAEPDPRNRLHKLMADRGPAGAYAWRVTSRVLAYAARRVPEIADNVEAIDQAMRWGYSWDLGPFEIWDALGFAETATRMEKDGLALPGWVKTMRTARATSFYRDGECWDPLSGQYQPRASDPLRVPLALLRRGGEPLLRAPGGSLSDLGDGVLGLTLGSKANSVDPDVISLLDKAVERAEADFRALVLYNEGPHFSVGANLLVVMMAAKQRDWERIRAILASFQAVNQRMKYAQVPVVAAPYGMTLGGGLEICLGAGAVQAAAETYAGLVEVGVGLIPSAGGLLNLLWRALETIPEGTKVDPLPYVAQLFTNIALAKVSTSAMEAKALGYLRHADGVTFDRDRLLHDAKARAIGLAEAGWHAPVPRAFVLPGESGIATLQMMVDALKAGGKASEHDAKISAKLASVLCGGVAGAAGPVTEERMLELEREGFLSLVGEPKTHERMQYMLQHNKPLRN